jgi:HEAT repeat protein
MAFFDRFGPNIERLKEKKDVVGLVSVLDTGDEALRSAAARELSTLGIPAVIGILNAMERMDDAERTRCARSLALPGIQVIPFFLHLVVRASPDLRTPIADALSRHGRPALEYLIAGKKNESLRIRKGVAMILGSMGKGAETPLRELLRDPDPAVRKEAALSLGRLGWEPDDALKRANLLFLRGEWGELVRLKKSAVSVLIGGLDDPNPAVRRNVVRTLGKIQDPKTFSRIIGVVDDPELDVRISAIEALGEMGDPRSTPLLVGLLGNSLPQIRMEAAWALDRIGWVPDDDSQRVASLIAKEQWNEILKLGRYAIPFLISALEEDHSGVRTGAVETLRKLGKPAHQALSKAAASQDATRAKAAATALGIMKVKNQEDRKTVHRKDDGQQQFSDELQEGLEARRAFERQRSPEQIPSRQEKADSRRDTVESSPRPARNSGMADGELQKMIEENESAVMSGFRKVARQTERDASGKGSEDDSPARSVPPVNPEELRRKIAANERAVVEGLRAVDRRRSAPERSDAGHVGITDPDYAALAAQGGGAPVIASQNDAGLWTGRPLAEAEISGIDSPELSPLDRLQRALRDPDADIRAAAVDSLRLMGEPAVDALMDTLDDPDHLVRVAAAEALGAIGGRKALGALLTLLKDADEDVRVGAVRSLAILGDPRALPFLIGQFSDSSSAIRSAAADSTAEFGDTSLAVLLSALADRQTLVRITAAEALGKLAHIKAVPSLIESLGDGVHEVRFGAAQALGEIGLPAIKPLIGVLKNGNREERLAVLEALGRILDERARAGIEYALNDSDPDVREKAEKALKKHEVFDVWRRAWLERLTQEEVVSPTAAAIEQIDERIFETHGATEIDNLITALKDRKGTSQMAAAMRLIMMGRPAVEGLIRAMKAEDPAIQTAAAEVLGEMRDITVEPLIDALHDDDVFVRIVAARNLGKIGNEQSLETLIGALQGDGDQRVRAVIAEALGYMGDARTIEPLTAALRDHDEAVQMAAARSLGHIIDRASIKPLIRALNDVDERVGRVALEALKDPDGSIHEHLLAALRHGEKQYRRGVADALDMIGWEPGTPEERAYYLIAKDRWAEIERVGPGAISPLEEALRDPDVGVRMEALKVISRIGGERSIEPLISSLADADAIVRLRAERSLIDMGSAAEAALRGKLGDDDAAVSMVLSRIIGRIQRSGDSPSTAGKEKAGGDES